MKVYKKYYIYSLVLACLMIIASFILFRYKLFTGQIVSQSYLYKKLLVYGMLGTVVVYSLYLRNMREKLKDIGDFDKKLAFHEKYFKIRMWWYVISCAVSCLIFLLSLNQFFFYFALFDLFMLMLVFPNKKLFWRELNDPEIIFI